jgi:hypothetical protein
MPELANNALFDSAPGGANDPRLPDSIARASEQNRVQAAKKWLQDGRDRLDVLANSHGLPRAQQFLPYLLVRTAVGDNGTRHIGGSATSSPDIWIAQGDPVSSPEIPPNQGPDSILGWRSYTIYAHVWNLGRAPTIGVKVEFYLNEGYGDLAPPSGGPLGVARVDLPPRSSLACHKLVRCPQAWNAEPIGGFHYLIVRASAIGDSISNNPWDPSNNRHVAVRRINVYTIAPQQQARS